MIKSEIDDVMQRPPGMRELPAGSSRWESCPASGFVRHCELWSAGPWRVGEGCVERGDESVVFEDEFGWISGALSAYEEDARFGLSRRGGVCSSSLTLEIPEPLEVVLE
ncbi:hypothetical protein CPI83_28780 (plasmid) [Rhodococcus sp. H-CA8f]|nr:hypothetical protein CPI83_28780 [Rhodococcus sp. H-CA8f]